jgi:uncharacterized protein
MGLIIARESSESIERCLRIERGDESALLDLCARYRDRLERMANLRLDRRLSDLGRRADEFRRASDGHGWKARLFMRAHAAARIELPIVTLTDGSPGPRTSGSCIRLDEFFQGISYVTLKVTSGCNLHCTYCNVDALGAHTPRMSIERFKQVAQLLLANSRQQRVSLEFHGGEPLLLADDWFEEAVGYARSLAAQDHKAVQFPLVTNGTLLTEERLLRLHGLGIVFCLSADGPPRINDQLRGGGAAVERALRLFKRHRIPCGILTVLGRANYNKMGEVMDWLADFGTDAFRVNFLQPQGRGADQAYLLSGEEMFEGMRQVLDHMDRTGVRVREDEMLQMVDRFLHGRQGQPRLSCWEFQCQAGRTYCAVDYTGTIHACGTDLRNHPLGHLDADLDRAHYEATLRRLHNKSDWAIRCFDCAARRICRHSCPTSDFNSEIYKEHECRFTKLTFAYLNAYPEKARRIDQALRGRRSQPPGDAFVPAERVRVIRDEWKCNAHEGRNDTSPTGPARSAARQSVRASVANSCDQTG